MLRGRPGHLSVSPTKQELFNRTYGLVSVLGDRVIDSRFQEEEILKFPRKNKQLFQPMRKRNGRFDIDPSRRQLGANTATEETPSRFEQENRARLLVQLLAAQCVQGGFRNNEWFQRLQFRCRVWEPREKRHSTQQCKMHKSIWVCVINQSVWLSIHVQTIRRWPHNTMTCCLVVVENIVRVTHHAINACEGLEVGVIVCLSYSMLFCPIVQLGSDRESWR